MAAEKGLLPSNFDTKTEEDVRQNFDIVDNSNYLLINTGVATREQVEDVLERFIFEAQSDLHKAGQPYFERIKTTKVAPVQKVPTPTPAKEAYILNLFSDRDGVYYGYGYAFVQDKRLFNLLLGRNADGSKRVSIEENDDDVDVLDPDFKWDEISIKEIPLGYAYQIGRFNYTDDQREMLALIGNQIVEPERKKADPSITENRFTSQRTPGPGVTAVPLTGTITIEPCGANKPDPVFFQPEVLFASHIPAWVTEQTIKEALLPFNRSDAKYRRPEGRMDKRGYQRVSEETYPVVTITTTKMGSRKMFVTFDPNTKDAVFALYMVRRLNVVQPGTNNVETISFSQAKNTRAPRDETAEVAPVNPKVSRAKMAKEVIRAMMGSGYGFVPGAISRALYQLVDKEEVQRLRALPEMSGALPPLPLPSLDPLPLPPLPAPSSTLPLPPLPTPVDSMTNAFAALGMEVDDLEFIPKAAPAKIISSRRRK